jgi:hypothetical protein
VGLTAFAAASWLLLGGNRDLPVGEIDTASRARLEQVLERADREDPR